MCLPIQLDSIFAFTPLNDWQHWLLGRVAWKLSLFIGLTPEQMEHSPRQSLSFWLPTSTPSQMKPRLGKNSWLKNRLPERREAAHEQVFPINCAREMFEHFLPEYVSPGWLKLIWGGQSKSAKTNRKVNFIGHKVTVWGRTNDKGGVSEVVQQCLAQWKGK